MTPREIAEKVADDYYTAGAAGKSLVSFIRMAIENERQRCADIVSAARFGEIDSDLRSIHNRIVQGETHHDKQPG